MTRHHPKSRVPKSLQGVWGSLLALSEDFSCDGTAVLEKVATDLYESIGTPISLSCEILLRYGDLRQLAERRIDPLSYNDPERFFLDYQSIEFLRKVPFEINGVDRELTAKTKFFEAEAQCKETNLRIRNFLSNPEKATTTVQRAFGLLTIMVREVLGDWVSSSDWINSCRFGPGSFNYPGHGGLTSIYDKLQVHPTVTKDFGDLGAILVMSSPSWARSVTDCEIEGFQPFVNSSHLTTVLGNRVEFVPKTALTDRAIAVEPLVNVYAQLGLGSIIRRRLNDIAFIDLNDQSFNQELAREGSIRGYLSTIDLSSASDTVARELVRAVLPDRWYYAMDVCRSKIGMIDGKSFVYEKFSSMGNGFTFELETLLFWAMARSACVISGCPEMVSVYGDDIIVPSDAYETLEEILTFFGFSLNTRKSFRAGPFRESCGKDYYDGTDVRPFLQKEVPDRLENLLTLANGLRRLANRRLYPFPGCDLRYRRAYEQTVRAIPRVISTHLRVPAHAGDTDGLVTDWDEAQRSSFVRREPNGWEGFVGIRLAPVPKDEPKKCYNFEGGVASLLYRARGGFEDSVYRSASIPIHESHPVSPRQGRDADFVLRNGAFWGPWTDLGPWL